MTIAEKLDNLFPAKCLACQTPLKRADAKWQNCASRLFCPNCGLDQDSAEAGSIQKLGIRQYSQASELDADQYDADWAKL